MQFKNPKEEKKLLNCICEVNVDGKMALVSLYDDLPHFEYDLTIDNLKDSITKLRTIIRELKQHIKKLENENTRFQTVNNVLSKNITSLYTTASNEIQRKDKIIDNLRKSQAPYRSKMFSSSNNFQVEKTEVNKLSENKENTEKFMNTVEKTKVLNINNNDNIKAIVTKPTLDIPKTIYSKRMFQKLAQQNETIESKKQMPQDIENTNTADKITQDKIEELNNDENVLLEMSTSIHNESKDIINSTLVICESDITPSDCELDTTPVIQCDNQEKDKENVSIESLSTRLKQPSKLKKKLIISPATIGVQNIHTKTFKCAKQLNQINNLASTTQCKITNSPEKQIIKSLNKEILSLSTSIKNIFPMHDPKTDNTPLTTDILDNQQLLTSEKKNQIQSMNIEVEQFPIRRKKTVIEKDNNSLALSNERKSSCVTYTSPSTDSEFNKSTENVKCLSKNKELDREPSSPFQQKNNQIKCNLNTIKCTNNIIESKHSDHSCKSSSKNTSVETSSTNNTVIPSINIEVEQVPIIRRTKVIENDNNTLNRFKKVTQESCIKDHKNKYDSKTNDKQLKTVILCDQKLSTCEKKNQNEVPSINIEVEQFPIRRRKTVIEKDNNSLALSNVRKRSCVTYTGPSIDSELNKSTEDVKCSSMNNDRVDSTRTKPFKCAKKLNQINNLNSKTQCEITNSPEKQIIKSLNKDTLSTCINNTFPEYDSKTDNKPLTTDILRNQQLFTSGKNNQIQSMNIEVEQFPIKRKKIVIEKDNNSLDLSNVRKRPCVTYISPSIDSEFNKSTKNVKCLSKNNDRKPSSSFQQNNNQSKCNLDTIKCTNNITEFKHLNNSFESSSKNTFVETSLTNKTVIPSINIEVEQGFIFRQSNARKVIMHSTSDDKQETKKGRRVQLITIEDHYSNPVPSFNGAKKTEIDISNKSILTEKVVESSSHFYVPQVKRRRAMNFSSADS